MLPHEYARSALKIGLQIEERPGVDPFKFGTVGAADLVHPFIIEVPYGEDW
jgi:hypothetical protein